VKHWYVVHEPTGKIIGEVLAELEPSYFQDHCTPRTETELRETARGQQMIEEWDE
jgi:hypothetical protein